MTASEAMVETLRVEGVTEVFGIVGSAYMDALDLFPAAGIRFFPVRHEQSAAHMADAFARVTGRATMCTGQNGPGITNMVTSIAAAYHAHSPVILLTPSSMSAFRGLDGFQEVEQLPIFSTVTKFQIQVNRHDRIAEAFRTAIRAAYAERGPVQIDVPRDFFYGEADYTILEPQQYRAARRGPGDAESLDQAAGVLAAAERPVILAGLGVTETGCADVVVRLARQLGAPIATSYQHNDAVPYTEELAVGPIGYQGSKAAMTLLSKADVVLALGTRLNPFGNLPQYGFDYFPKDAKIIQVDIDWRQVGRIKPLAVGILGDAQAAAEALLGRLVARQGERDVDPARLAEIRAAKSAWTEELASWSRSDASPISPRRALAELAAALPDDAIVTSDIGNICSVANAYMKFDRPRSFLPALGFGNCGFAYPGALGAKVAAPDRPVAAIIGDGAWGMSLHEVMTAVEEDLPVVACVFNNRQWGAEKKNQIDYYDDRFIGANIGHEIGGFDFAAIARAMGADGVRVEEPGDLAEAYRSAFASGRPTVVEVMVDPDELAEPFRRDALKTPRRYLERYQHLDVANFSKQPAGAR
ncbi:MAG: sulfoacetaldehyde acetyltransferase [Actinobacteria bacterium]|nr:sulfoacetaldehyde acetyltransferase [Actinomycetota bacterium]